MTLTIDSSVFIADLNIEDATHVKSLKFFNKIFDRYEDLEIVIPITVVIEVVHALLRVGVVVDINSVVRQFFAYILIHIDHRFIEQYLPAMKLFSSLKTADAVVAATAAKHQAVLITWDRQLITKSLPIIESYTPSEYLNQLTS